MKKGRKSARELTRARILLLANQQREDTGIAETLDVGRNTVWRIKKKYRKEGLQSALAEKPRSGQPKKYTEKHEAEIIAQACTEIEKNAGSDHSFSLDVTESTTPCIKFKTSPKSDIE